MAARNARKSRNSTRTTTARSSHALGVMNPQAAPMAMLQAWTTPFQALQLVQAVQAQMLQRGTASLVEAVEKFRSAQNPVDAFAAQAEFFWANCMSGMQATADILQAMGQLRNAQGTGDDFAHPTPPLYAPATPDAFMMRH